MNSGDLLGSGTISGPVCYMSITISITISIATATNLGCGFVWVNVGDLLEGHKAREDE